MLAVGKALVMSELSHFARACLKRRETGRMWCSEGRSVG